MRISLRAKLFLVVLAGVVVPTVLGTLYLYQRHRNNLDEAFLHQGRTMFGQIVVTRRWLSSHGGVYVYKRPFVKDSPYLDHADTATLDGHTLTLRSPDMVTREISELAVEQGLSRFRIVSLEPINPMNEPDPWERQALESFHRGSEESWSYSRRGPDTSFRYMAPIFTESSCLRCHQEFGHREGEVRGGISVEFPVGPMLEEAHKDFLSTITGMGVMGLAVIVLSWIGARAVMIRPLSSINRAVTAMAEGDYDRPLPLSGNDELGDLARTVAEMRTVIRDYNRNLQEEVEARTGELELMRSHAQQERDFLINLFDRMADGVCVASTEDFSIEYINPSLEEVFGPIGDRSCSELFLASGSEPLSTVKDGEPGQVMRREVAARDGSRVFDVVATSLANPDGTRSWLLVFRDITERKRLEQALVEMNRTLEAKVRQQTEALLEQEKLAAMGEVSAGLAHEIRNPLSAILSGVSLLESPRRTGEERDHIISLIKKEARRLNASLTDFLLFARPNEPSKVRIDPTGLVREIVRLLDEDQEIKGQVKIVTDLADLPPVWFDDYQLRQLIWNVVLNAIQAMNGEGTLTIRTARQGGDQWTIEIGDTGPGIPGEIRSRVFDPFFSTKKEGTGLGLSIVRRISQAHGGEVRFDCPPEGGTVFFITAPIGGPGDNNNGAGSGGDSSWHPE